MMKEFIWVLTEIFSAVGEHFNPKGMKVFWCLVAWIPIIFLTVILVPLCLCFYLLSFAVLLIPYWILSAIRYVKALKDWNKVAERTKVLLKF